MTRTGSTTLDEFMTPLPGSRPVRAALGATAVLTLLCGFAVTGRAASTPQDTMPALSITTAAIAPADVTAAVVTPDQTAPEQTAQAQTAQAKPASHRLHRIELQSFDTASLSAPAFIGLVGHARVIDVSATALRPAPLPDQDVDAPGPDAQTLASQQEASVAPSVYGNKDHFSGDGFAAGSNLENDKNNRRKPGGGMSLSIPVQ